MKWIGLTGGIATGKSTVSSVLRTLGYEVLDADEISRLVTGPGGEALPAIFTAFGDQLKNGDGSLNRKALADLVFGREEQRRKLEAIIHPLVRSRIHAEKKRLENAGKNVAFYDVPLLYENNMAGDFDAVLVVAAPEELQLQRLMKRNSLNDSEARQRLKSQIPIEEKQKKTPYVIHNSKDLEFLNHEVTRVLRELGV